MAHGIDEHTTSWLTDLTRHPLDATGIAATLHLNTLFPEWPVLPVCFIDEAMRFSKAET